MANARMRRMAIFLIALGLAVSGAGYYGSHRNMPPPIVITEPTGTATAAALPMYASPPPAPKPEPSAPDASLPAQTLYYVHVAGAVLHPAVYQLPPGSRVLHAIKAAGGATSQADLDAINLAEKVTDGEKVFVPQKGDRQAISPAAERPHGAAAAGSRVKLASPQQGKINLNTANDEQLERLPGVGPAMAGRIMTYRQQAGGFQKIDDLTNVGGIGPKKFAKIAPFVRVN